MPTKLPKRKGFTKAFSKTKLGYLLDKEIGKGEFDWSYDYTPKVGDTGWHPSGHCTPSLYELYMFAASELVILEERMKQAEMEVDSPDAAAPIDKNARVIEAPLSKIFQVGHFWHQYLQEICLRAGLCEESHVERRGELVWMSKTYYTGGGGDGIELPEPFHWATGSADICPMEIPGHGPYLIDFKTMGSHQFRGNTPHHLTMEKWECQLNTYMEFFDMEKAIILGINKDAPHDYKEFEFHRNQELIDSLVAKWKLVSACLDEGVAPPEDEPWELPIKGAVNV